MSKTPVQLQPLDQAVGAQLSAVTVLPKITLPASGAGATTVVKRAQCTDFSQDLLPRFGIERTMIQSLQEVQGETTTSGDKIFKPINDIHDAVRFIGGSWAALNDGNGQRMVTTDGLTTNAIEITFYGTGLNFLHITGFSYDARVSTDGGTESANVIPTASSVLASPARNYATNQIIQAVSGLTLGLHTVKIRQGSSTGMAFYGYEVLNTNSTLQQTPGTSYLGGKRLYASALTTSSPTNGFTNTYGTAGSKGSHVLVYQKPDGTTAKDARYTEVTAAYLTSASHTNEDVIKTTHWREFGAGRTDDFSSLTPASNANVAFTLDDGTTTLVGSNVGVLSGELLAFATTTGFFTFTFVGTGLDIVRQDSGTGTATHTVDIDGVAAPSLSTTGSTSRRIEKIASGLPYGTHTVKISKTGATAYGLGLAQFIIYGPSKPVLPAGCVELADYYVMADYTANSTAGLETIATGTLRKACIREMIYSTPSGSYAIGIDPTLYVGAFQVSTSVSGAAVKYTFFGTGFELRGRANTVFTTNATLSIDGSANWSAFTSSAYGGFSIVNSTTGQISQGVSNTLGSGIRVSGLALGLHTVTLTCNTASSYVIETLDIITPIHAVKGNLPGDIQNTQNVGSCALSDNRVFSSTAVKPLANWAQAIGISGGSSTTSTSAVPIADMSCTIKTSGNPVQISYNIDIYNNTIAYTTLQIMVDGMPTNTPNLTYFQQATGSPTPVSGNIIVPMAAGVHKIDLYYYVSAGTGFYHATSRILTVKEL